MSDNAIRGVKRIEETPTVRLMSALLSDHPVRMEGEDAIIFTFFFSFRVQSIHFSSEFARSPRPKLNSPIDADKRIIYGIPIHLLKGGIPVDDAPLEWDGDGTVILGYDWAPHDASLFASEYGTKKVLTWRINWLYIVRDVEDSRLIRARVNLRNERVYHGKGSSPDDFFFMYANFFEQLCIRVPFTEFQMVVLREMNVAPTQLHPNSCAAVQAFLAMCLAVDITPTIPVFFHYFDVRSFPKGVIIDDAGRHEFHDTEGNPLFPFYGTRNLRKIKAYLVGTMNLVDLEVVHTINALRRRLSARNLVECLRHEDCERKAYHVCSSPYKSNFMASRKGVGANSSSARERVAPIALSPPIIKYPSSKAATTSTQPFIRKRKGHKEGEKSASKKGHKEKEGSSSRSASKKACKGKEASSSRPLPDRVFSSTFNMSDQTNFHMSSTHHALIESLFEAELTNTMLEMSTRAASLAWYLREFVDRRGVEHDPGDTCSLGRAHCSPPDQVDSGSVWNSLFINLDFRRIWAAVVLREELSVHQSAKLTVVPFGTPRSSTWIFAGSGQQWFFEKNSLFTARPS
ncbi:hypothetical protein LR48_Vigan11g040500 [Vigna angularis]|uniref:Transposase (putative) gypsy type domain-containing protein n=1 Tax=Phaseolus angularis TaxID=3914 RepID=A0A0L9VR70_PHAAN|nr:hypothetical protein LR48_Vigan11g040500 [Vigna angularis]